jgi:hypothetical protein
MKKYGMLVVIASMLAIVVWRVGFGNPLLLARVLVVVLGTVAGVQALYDAVLNGWRTHVASVLRAAGGFFLAASVLGHMNVYLIGASALFILGSAVAQKRSLST